jgi:hypothetical protein
MPSSLRRALAVIVPVACLCVTGPATASAASVHVLGTAYEFNNVHTMLAGGVVKVAEYPKLSATIRSDGSYDIAVPDRKKVTLYAVAAGYHSIYTQTFATGGEDLDNVNLQTPTDAVYDGLKALLSVPVDANDNPSQCAIVSTFSTVNVRDLSYQQFIAYGAHGVAGGTASGSPALPTATYFNENVIPDPAQKLSSKDGGVVWTRVPSGVYRISAKHPTTKFAPFTATCVPGRVVNANPPWGLHQLAKDNSVTAKAAWTRTAKGAKLRSLKLSRLAKGSILTIACAGKGCGLKHLKVVGSKKSTLDVRKVLGSAASSFRRGQGLTVRVRTHPLNGRVFTWVVPKGRTPKTVTQCLPLGDRKAVQRCG